MYCAKCGHENSDLATHCAFCGADLTVFGEDEKTSLDSTVELHIPVSSEHLTDSAEVAEGDTARRPQVIDATYEPFVPGSDGDTERREQVTEASPEPDPQQNVTHQAQVLVRNQAHKTGGFFSRYQRPIAITCALLVIAVVGVAWLMLSLKDRPSKAELSADLATRYPAFAYTGGTYGFDTVITLSDVAITSLEPIDTPEGVEAATGVGPNAYQAEAEAFYKDSHVSVYHDFTCTYVRSDNGWQPSGEIEEGVIEVEAESGVDEGKVLQNVAEILSQTPTENGVALQDVYGSGNVHVADRTFTPKTRTEKATDVLVLSCHRDFAFYSYDGTITCTFAFDNNEWGLVSSVADEAATMRTNTSVVGVWSGTAIDHTASGGTCYGAEGKPVTISIDTVEDMDAAYTTVTGTISGTVHAHPENARKQMSNLDDLEIEGVPFTGTLTTSTDSSTGAELTLEATCTVELPERANTRLPNNLGVGESEEDEEGTLKNRKKTDQWTTEDYEDYYLSLAEDGGTEPSLELSLLMSFGSTNDPTGVFLDLTSTYTSQEVILLVVPRETQARFTDTYQLVRAS